MCPCLLDNSNSEDMENIQKLVVQRLEAIASRIETTTYGNKGNVKAHCNRRLPLPRHIIIIIIINIIITYRLINFAVGCQWGPWRTEACSKSCGGGIRLKIRGMEMVESDSGQCLGPASSTERCNSQACPAPLGK